MKRLYVNSASSELARSTLARMYQQSEESIAAFSNRLSKCIDRSYPTQTSAQRETRKLEEFTVRILPSLRLSLYRTPLTTFVEAISEAERLETAHRATGIPLASSQYAHLNVNERISVTTSQHTYSQINEQNNSPSSIRQSRPAPSENNVSIEKHNPVPSFSSDSSSQRVFSRFVEKVQFKPDANTLHFYEKNAPTPIEHEPNLSLQPSRSSLKPTGYRSPRTVSPSTSARYNTIGLPRTLPPNNSNWILKDPPITPPNYRRRSDGLIEPQTPPGYMRRPDPDLSSRQSRPEQTFSHRTDQPSRENTSNSRSDQRQYQHFRSPPNRRRDSSL